MRRLLAVGFLAAVLGALGSAAPALANTDTATCVVNGTMTTSPPVNLLSTGTGTYTFFSGQGTTPAHLECALTDTVTGEVGVADVNVNSTGTYALNCTTGGSITSTANSLGGRILTLAGSSQPGADLGLAVPTMIYKIFLIGGHGRFFWQPGSSITGINATGGPLRVQVQDPGDGTISLVPNYDADLIAGQCSTHFTVTGVIGGQFNGTA